MPDTQIARALFYAVPILLLVLAAFLARASREPMLRWVLALQGALLLKLVAIDLAPASLEIIQALWLLETGILCLVLASRVSRMKRQPSPDLSQVLCHDLATPLSIVLSLSESRAESGDRAWVKVHAAALRQRSLIERVRKMHSLDHGKIKAVLEPTPVEDVVRRLIEDHDQRIRDKELALDFQAEPGAREALALVDPILFEETVLGNLLGNAIKFSAPRSRITIRAYAGRDRVELRIRDEGTGIPAAQLEVLFRAGKKTSRPGTQGEKGTGLGLQLAWAATHAMKGELELRNAAPGVEARVSVPRAPGR